MGDIEISTCDMCKQEKQVSRKYYNYDVACECHGRQHFEIVRYCKDCQPKPPRTTTIAMKPLNEMEGRDGR